MKGEHKRRTLAEAQRLIEFESEDKQGRALKRELLNREAQLGVKIMTRSRRRSKTTHRVTLAAIRKHCPDLMPSRADELLKEARAYLSGIDERIDHRVANQIAARVEPKIRRLERDRDRVAETVRDLSGRVNRLAAASQDHH